MQLFLNSPLQERRNIFHPSLKNSLCRGTTSPFTLVRAFGGRSRDGESSGPGVPPRGRPKADPGAPRENPLSYLCKEGCLSKKLWTLSACTPDCSNLSLITSHKEGATLEPSTTALGKPETFPGMGPPPMQGSWVYAALLIGATILQKPNKDKPAGTSDEALLLTSEAICLSLSRGGWHKPL